MWLSDGGMGAYWSWMGRKWLIWQTGLYSTWSPGLQHQHRTIPTYYIVCSNHHYLRQYGPAPFVVGFDAHLQAKKINLLRRCLAFYLVFCLRLESIETIAGKIVLGVDHYLRWISRRNGHRGGGGGGGFFIQFEVFLKVFRLEKWQDLSFASTPTPSHINQMLVNGAGFYWKIIVQTW